MITSTYVYGVLCMCSCLSVSCQQGNVADGVLSVHAFFYFPSFCGLCVSASNFVTKEQTQIFIDNQKYTRASYVYLSRLKSAQFARFFDCFNGFER